MSQRTFTLSTLLIIPFALTPLLLSLREILNLVTDRELQWRSEIVTVGVIYPLGLTLYAYFRRPQSQRSSLGRSIVFGTVRGSMYGVVFYLVLFVPVMITQQILLAQKAGWQGVHPALVKLIAGSVLIGVVFGAVAGAAAGAIASIISRNQSRSAEQLSNILSDDTSL